MKSLSQILAAAFFFSMFALTVEGQTMTRRSDAKATLKIDKSNTGQCAKVDATASYLRKGPATFQFDILTLEDGQTVEWDFGDGNGSRMPWPKHTYSKAGNFLVTLIVRAPCGATASTSLVITVNPFAKNDSGQ